MSPPNRPFASELPGIEGLKLTIEPAKNKATFVDKSGSERVLNFCLFENGSERVLTICLGNESICSFVPCPSPHQNLWFASGVHVSEPGNSIGSYFYALARDLLNEIGASITPSGNLTAEGVALWNKLDPKVKFRVKNNPANSFEPS